MSPGVIIRALRFLAILYPALGFLLDVSHGGPHRRGPSTSASGIVDQIRLQAGLAWQGAERYGNQPSSPVVALVTRHRAYATDFSQFFGSRGYAVKVLSTRTLTKLGKLVDRTQPEAIVIDSHVARDELVGLLESVKANPDLWLVPIFLLANSTSPFPPHSTLMGLRPMPPASATSSTSATSEAARFSEEGEEEEEEEGVWRLQCLRAGVDRFLPRHVSSFEEMHSVLMGRGALRRRIEKLANAMQETILDLRVHRRPLLPSTMVLVDNPPELTGVQQEVLNLVARGLTDTQIAHSMQVGPAVVRNALTKLMASFKADTRCELVRIALDNDLLTE